MQIARKLGQNLQKTFGFVRKIAVHNFQNPYFDLGLYYF